MSFLRTHVALIVAFVALLVLLAANAALAPLSWGALGIGLHLFLAFAMAIVIAVMFMGLRYTGALLRVFALGGLLWLAFMWVLIPIDYFTR